MTELEDLRARLAEAEEALRAIRNGEVDAVVVAGERGEQVYTLNGADRIYRQLIETMSEGAVILSAGGVIRYGNASLAKMLGCPLDLVLGTALRDHLPPADQQSLGSVLSQARTEPSRREINLKTSEGRLLPAYLSASRLHGEGTEMVFCLVLTDLTDQKHHEQIVSEERLARLILEQAAEAIVVCDEQGRVIRASKAAARFCDGSPLMRPLAEVFPLLTADSGSFSLAPALQGKTLLNVDVALNRQGREFALILNAGPLLSGQRVLGCVVTLTDITERKAAQRAHERLAAMVAGSNDAILGTTPEGIIVDWNRAAAQLYGYPSAEVIGRSVVMLLPAEHQGVVAAHLRMMSAGEVIRNVDVVSLRKDGSRFDGALTLSYIRDGVGALIGIAAIVRDVTERKRAEAELERLRTAIEQASESIVITDLNGEILYVNPAATQTTGYAREEVLGKNARIFKSGKHDKAFYRELWETISSGRTWKGRLINKCKDGTFVAEETTISPVRDGAGVTINYVAVKRNVTERLRLEDELRQSQKMESAGRLAGGVAHDFNNILTVINGYAGFALKGLPESDQWRDDLNEVLAAGERAARLTRQLLAFSRKQILNPEILDINAAVGAIVNMLKRVIGEDIKLETRLAARPCLTKVDAGQIEQVFLNLAVNARDAMPKGGTLTFETEIAAATEDCLLRHPDMSRGPLVCLRVRDTGCGMTDEVKAHIFEPFYTTKEKGKGTGLGLSMVYGIIKQSGGDIEVESAPGQGTTFRICFPRIDAQNLRQAEDKNKDVVTGGDETLLLVEDEDTIRRLGVRALTANGYTVLSAADGQEALKVLERHGRAVDLLITDVVMPGMSGRELARTIAAMNRARRTLFISGFTDDAIVQHGVLEPGLAFMYKPFSPDALLLKIRAILDGPADQSKA